MVWFTLSKFKFTTFLKFESQYHASLCSRDQFHLRFKFRYTHFQRMSLIRLTNLTALCLSHWSLNIPLRFAQGIIRLTLQTSLRLFSASLIKKEVCPGWNKPLFILFDLIEKTIHLYYEANRCPSLHTWYAEAYATYVPKVPSGICHIAF